MVHQLEFPSDFQVQHTSESIKRKFCGEDEEDSIKQVSFWISSLFFFFFFFFFYIYKNIILKKK